MSDIVMVCIALHMLQKAGLINREQLVKYRSPSFSALSFL